eukprot:TRINITY_DN67393_c1_g1_i1.p1 TRINITY_DN67393_c1_g1~~TRINITY_DN67393_c1_g1_i1.p1  ORF type:complete len:462 (+),score=23.59 TRINITY_DN67393_c1_g1_i1:43-1428(+)
MMPAFPGFGQGMGAAFGQPPAFGRPMDPLQSVMESGNLALAKQLLQERRATAPHIPHEVILLWSITNNYLDFAKHIFKEGYQYLGLTQDYVGVISLLHASRIGRLEVVKHLIQNGYAKVWSVSSTGETPIACAARMGQLEVVKWLIEQAGPPTAITGSASQTALDFASKGGQLDTVKWLLKNGDFSSSAKDGALIHAASNGQVQVAKWFLQLRRDAAERELWEAENEKAASSTPNGNDTAGSGPPNVLFLFEEQPVTYVAPMETNQTSTTKVASAGEDVETNRETLGVVKKRKRAAYRAEMFAKFDGILVKDCLRPAENAAYHELLCAAAKSKSADMIELILMEGWWVVAVQPLTALTKRAKPKPVVATSKSPWWCLSTEEVRITWDEVRTHGVHLPAWISSRMLAWNVKDHSDFPVVFQRICCFAMWCLHLHGPLPDELLGCVFRFWATNTFSPRLAMLF